MKTVDTLPPKRYKCTPCMDLIQMVASNETSWSRKGDLFLGCPRNSRTAAHQCFIEGWTQALSASPWNHVVLFLLLSADIVLPPCKWPALYFFNPCWPRTLELTSPEAPATCKDENQYFPIRVLNFLKWTCECLTWNRRLQTRPLCCVQLCQSGTHGLCATSGHFWTSGIPVNCDHQVKNYGLEKFECW